MADILDDLLKQANQRGLAGACEIRAYDEIKLLRQQLAEADELIDANEEWALPDAVRLAPFYDAAIARHRIRKASSEQKE